MSRRVKRCAHAISFAADEAGTACEQNFTHKWEPAELVWEGPALLVWEGMKEPAKLVCKGWKVEATLLSLCSSNSLVIQATRVSLLRGQTPLQRLCEIFDGFL